MESMNTSKEVGHNSPSSTAINFANPTLDIATTNLTSDSTINNHGKKNRKNRMQNVEKMRRSSVIDDHERTIIHINLSISFILTNSTRGGQLCPIGDCTLRIRGNAAFELHVLSHLAPDGKNASGDISSITDGTRNVKTASEQSSTMTQFDSQTPTTIATDGNNNTSDNNSRNNAMGNGREKYYKLVFHCPIDGCVYHKERFLCSVKYLKQHYKKIHFDKLLKCSKCDRMFGAPAFLFDHERQCGIEFECECKKSYKDLSILQTHARRTGHCYDAEKYKQLIGEAKKNEKPIKMILVNTLLPEVKAPHEPSIMQQSLPLPFYDDNKKKMKQFNDLEANMSVKSAPEIVDAPLPMGPTGNGQTYVSDHNEKLGEHRKTETKCIEMEENEEEEVQFITERISTTRNTDTKITDRNGITSYSQGSTPVKHYLIAQIVQPELEVRNRANKKSNFAELKTPPTEYIDVPVLLRVPVQRLDILPKKTDCGTQMPRQTLTRRRSESVKLGKVKSTTGTQTGRFRPCVSAETQTSTKRQRCTKKKKSAQTQTLQEIHSFDAAAVNKPLSSNSNKTKEFASHSQLFMSSQTSDANCSQKKTIHSKISTIVTKQRLTESKLATMSPSKYVVVQNNAKLKSQVITQFEARLELECREVLPLEEIPALESGQIVEGRDYCEAAPKAGNFSKSNYARQKEEDGIEYLCTMQEENPIKFRCGVPQITQTVQGQNISSSFIESVQVDDLRNSLLEAFSDDNRGAETAQYGNANSGTFFLPMILNTGSEPKELEPQHFNYSENFSELITFPQDSERNWAGSLDSENLSITGNVTEAESRSDEVTLNNSREAYMDFSSMFNDMSTSPMPPTDEERFSLFEELHPTNENHSETQTDLIAEIADFENPVSFIMNWFDGTTEVTTTETQTGRTVNQYDSEEMLDISIEDQQLGSFEDLELYRDWQTDSGFENFATIPDDLLSGYSTTDCISFLDTVDSETQTLSF